MLLRRLLHGNASQGRFIPGSCWHGGSHPCGGSCQTGLGPCRGRVGLLLTRRAPAMGFPRMSKPGFGLGVVFSPTPLMPPQQAQQFGAA